MNHFFDALAVLVIIGAILGVGRLALAFLGLVWWPLRSWVWKKRN